MMYGLIGHQFLKDPSKWEWVRTAARSVFEKSPPPCIGYTSLAEGSDQILAEEVIKTGGEIHVIVPFEGYESAFKSDVSLSNYYRLLVQAKSVEVLSWQISDQHSYLLAGKKVVDLSEIVIAIWDGKKAKGLGGTGDVVEYAIVLKKRIIQIQPITSIVFEVEY